MNFAPDIYVASKILDIKNAQQTIEQINEIDNKLIQANCIPPVDAIVIDTTRLRPEEVLDKAMKLCRNKNIHREIQKEEFTR